MLSTIFVCYLLAIYQKYKQSLFSDLASYNTKTSVWSNAVDISPRTGQFSPGAGANIAYNGSYFAVAFVNESSYDIYVQYGIGTAGTDYISPMNFSLNCLLNQNKWV